MLLAEEQQIKKWVEDELTVVKIGILLGRKGVVVPHRTLARFAVERCGAGRRKTTVRVDDPPPATELQVDFGRLGLVPDGERRRVCHGLVFTACYSRHQFVWPTFAQTIEEVIEGFEAAWAFFGGVFPVVIPDQMSAVVDEADNLPRGSTTPSSSTPSRVASSVDAARIRRPTDKPRVEHIMPSARPKSSPARLQGRHRCAHTSRGPGAQRRPAGRVHGTTQLPPHRGLPGRGTAAALARTGGSLRRSQVVQPQGAQRFPLRGRPGDLQPAASARRPARGEPTGVRQTVKFYFRGELVKFHPRKPPGQRSTDPADLPSGKEIYATRDLERLQASGRRARRGRRALRHGAARHAAAVDRACARSTGCSAW